MDRESKVEPGTSIHMGFEVGQTFGDYAITASLDAGGMGRVFKVEHCLTKRTEAMKVLSAELATEIQIKRFEREIRALARLNHPNIGALHNALHSENDLILLMEYIEGQTLESMLNAGRLPLDTGIGYIRQILSALGYAHQQGVVHRDVTPAHVMITAGSQVKLTDFGLSKSFGDTLLTNCGEVLGSLPYLAPERLKGTTQPDRRSDLYSVGAILYEHLTGQKPFGPNRRLAPVLTDSENEPQPPSQIETSLSPEWDDIIRRALARDPAHRYQSAEEFRNAIAQLNVTAVAGLPLPQPRKIGIAIALFSALLLAGVASPALNQFRQVAPVVVPWRRLHIVPPAFATDQTPAAPAVPATLPPTRPIARRAVRTVPVAAATPVLVKAPAVADAPVVASSPVVASAPLVVDTPVVAEAPESGPSQNPTPAKRGFWSKLNVFKKKSADATEKH
jgi:serine/threonine protein kinase